jgi:hypothetical protein
MAKFYGAKAGIDGRVAIFVPEFGSFADPEHVIPDAELARESYESGSMTEEEYCQEIFTLATLGYDVSAYEV